jgi:hypothetical protein
MNTKPPLRLEELDAGHPLRRHLLEVPNAGVPEGYFDTLASRVQARVAKPQEDQPLISWSWGRTVGSLAGAGLVAVLVWLTWPQRQGAIGQETLSGVSDAAIVAYLDEQGLNPDEVLAAEPNRAIISNDYHPAGTGVAGNK